MREVHLLLMSCLLAVGCADTSDTDTVLDGGAPDGGQADGGTTDGGARGWTCMECHGSEDELQRTADEDTGSPVQSDSGEG